MTRKGPNNAKHVIWAIGEFYFLLFHVFNTIYCFNSLLCNREGSNNENRPKQCQMHRLGHR